VFELTELLGSADQRRERHPDTILR
jgi:hypothetical protein